MIRAALFDMDGLIIDSEPHWRRAEMACFREVGIDLTEDDCRQTMGYRLNEVVDFWYDQHPWNNLSKATLEEMIVDRMIKLVRADGRALPGVAHAIDLFSRQGFRLGVASSSPDRLIQAVMQTLGLADAFEVFQSAQHEAFGKPHPQVFLTAAAKLGAQPQHCIVLEDSFHGVIAGKAAKMKVIAVPDAHDRLNRGYGAADLVLDTLTALAPEHLAQLLPTAMVP